MHRLPNVVVDGLLLYIYIYWQIAHLSMFCTKTSDASVNPPQLQDALLYSLISHMKFNLALLRTLNFTTGNCAKAVNWSQCTGVNLWGGRLHLWFSLKLMQCSVVKLYEIQWAQCSTDHCSVMKCSAMQWVAIKCSAMKFSAVQYNSLQCSILQFSTVQYSTVPCWAARGGY